MRLAILIALVAVPPAYPEPLAVPGFAPASHVGPDDADARPRPVVVVLHGNFDRPEWECDVWKAAAGFHGWILCPRGVRTPWATRAEDRFTYGTAAAVRKEIEAGLAALEARYPGRVTRENMVLAGFSLGAILAPGLAEADPGRYPTLFLVEGGVEKLDPKRIASLKAAGVRGVGLAMSSRGRIRKAEAAMKQLQGIGIASRIVDMFGAGHNYSPDFGLRGREALRALLARGPDNGR